MWSDSHLCAGEDFSVSSALSIQQPRGEEATNEFASLKSGISPVWRAQTWDVQQNAWVNAPV